MSTKFFYPFSCHGKWEYREKRRVQDVPIKKFEIGTFDLKLTMIYVLSLPDSNTPSDSI